MTSTHAKFSPQPAKQSPATPRVPDEWARLDYSVRDLCSTRIRVAAALLSFVLLPSCCTGILWGAWGDDERDRSCGHDSTRWTWDDVSWRLLLTPLTVALDLATCPLQSILFACEDEQEQGHGRRRR